MLKGNPRLGKCMCGSPATIRDTKAEDGRLHYTCHDLTPEGKSKHYGFVDASFQAIILYRADVELNIGCAGLVSGIRLY